jgi:hypothetical protein
VRNVAIRAFVDDSSRIFSPSVKSELAANCSFTAPNAKITRSGAYARTRPCNSAVPCAIVKPTQPKFRTSASTPRARNAVFELAGPALALEQAEAERRRIAERCDAQAAGRLRQLRARAAIPVFVDAIPAELGAGPRFPQPLVAELEDVGSGREASVLFSIPDLERGWRGRGDPRGDDDELDQRDQQQRSRDRERDRFRSLRRPGRVGHQRAVDFDAPTPRADKRSLAFFVY